MSDEATQAVAAFFHLNRSLSKDSKGRREKYGTDKVFEAIRRRAEREGIAKGRES